MAARRGLVRARRRIASIVNRRRSWQPCCLPGRSARR